MVLVLVEEDDYEEVMVRLSDTLASWGCWDDSWAVPTSGTTHACARLGSGPVAQVFRTVPVTGQRGVWLGAWRFDGD